MLEGFERIQLTNGRTFVSITDSGINFNCNVVIKMKSAEYIMFLINKSSKIFAIKSCSKSDQDATRFVKETTNVKNGIRYNNHDLIFEIASIMDWNLSTSKYRIDGKYIPEENAMLFDLNTARTFAKKSTK